MWPMYWCLWSQISFIASLVNIFYVDTKAGASLSPLQIHSKCQTSRARGGEDQYLLQIFTRWQGRRFFDLLLPLWVLFLQLLQHIDLQLGGLPVLVHVLDYLQRQNLVPEKAKLSRNSLENSWCCLFASGCLCLWSCNIESNKNGDMEEEYICLDYAMMMINWWQWWWYLWRCWRWWC